MGIDRPWIHTLVEGPHINNTSASTHQTSGVQSAHHASVCMSVYCVISLWYRGRVLSSTLTRTMARTADMNNETLPHFPDLGRRETTVIGGSPCRARYCCRNYRRYSQSSKDEDTCYYSSTMI